MVQSPEEWPGGAVQDKAIQEGAAACQQLVDLQRRYEELEVGLI